MTAFRLVLLFSVLLTFAAQAEETKSCPAPGKAAPPFGLLMSDGSPGISLRSALKKKLPVVVNFWAWNCTGCVEELPMFQKVATALDGKATFLLVHPKDEEKMKAKLAELKVTLPSATDDNKEVTNAYCVTELPRTFIIDAAGIVRATLPAVDEATLRREIAKLSTTASK